MEQQCRSGPRSIAKPHARRAGLPQPRRTEGGHSGWLFVVTLLAAILAYGLWLPPAGSGPADSAATATLASAAHG